MAGLIIFAVLAAVFAVLYFHQKMEIRKLTRRAESYLTGGNPIDISLHDNDLSALQNSVAELENALTLSREQTRKESQRSTDLLADISHQLKTPLASLRLFLELDEGAHLTEELCQIDRMEHLIYSLLRLERMCSDGYTFQFSAHSIKDIVLDNWQGLSVRYPEKQFSVEGNANLRCDEVWLGEAFTNLLKNACEHTEMNGEIKVSISETEQEVCVRISDNGGGVSPEELPRLFERFYHGKETTGAGIGLNIAREIIWRHHGTISPENTEIGLQFTIYLPKLDHNLAKS